MKEIKSTKQVNKNKGNVGENMAVNFLATNSYVILDTNYKCKIGEIDIIAKDETGRIIFVEVKRRETAKFGMPRDAVNYPKQLKIKKTAQLYMLSHKLNNAYVRFDVIEILADQITHLTNAF